MTVANKVFTRGPQGRNESTHLEKWKSLTCSLPKTNISYLHITCYWYRDACCTEGCHIAFWLNSYSSYFMTCSAAKMAPLSRPGQDRVQIIDEQILPVKRQTYRAVMAVSEKGKNIKQKKCKKNWWLTKQYKHNYNNVINSNKCDMTIAGNAKWKITIWSPSTMEKSHRIYDHHWVTKMPS